MARISRQRGITMIEVLAASTIVVVTMIGTAGVFFRTITLSSRTTDLSIASSIARREIERSKQLGFSSLADGTTVTYFDVQGECPVSRTTSPSYIDGCTTKLASDRFSSTTVVSTTGTGNAALRTVTVTVRRISDNATLETTGTYFAWGGP